MPALAEQAAIRRWFGHGERPAAGGQAVRPVNKNGPPQADKLFDQ